MRGIGVSIGVLIVFSAQVVLAQGECTIDVRDAKLTSRGCIPSPSTSGGGGADDSAARASAERKEREAIATRAKAWYLEEGASYYVRGDYRNAIASFEDAQLRRPADEEIEAWLQRARAALAAASRGASAVAVPAPFRRTDTIRADAVALAQRLRWPTSEQTRLAAALARLSSDGDLSVTSRDVVRTWRTIIGRGADPAVIRAAGGTGSRLPAAGTQSFEDCAVFAIANAAGLPYSVVATRATELVREAPWRTPAERGSPQGTIETGGLIGVELVMLTEAMGQADIVGSAAFFDVVGSNRSVMVNVVPPSGNFSTGHEVVLSRAFRHEGVRWFEMIDSNQNVMERRYLTEAELNTILQETGIAFRSNSGTTPSPLRR